MTVMQRAHIAAIATSLLLVGACGGGAKTHLGGPALTAPRAPIVEAGARFSLELDANGVVHAWGHNATGELGDGTIDLRDAPVAVRGLPAGQRVIAIAAGASHVLALESDGSVWAWGHNRSGQLGNGGRNDSTAPVRVKGLHDVRAVGAGDAFSVALEADGTVLAWGNNASGQLGDGNAPIDHATPAPVHGLGAGSGVIAVAVGKSQALVLERNGAVLAWGNGTSGELGDGQSDKRSAPTPVVGLGPGSGVVAIAAGGSHCLAAKADGSVWAWGNNKSGQLGDGTRPSDHTTPVAVHGLAAGSGVVAVAAGDAFSLAMTRDGRVFAWGRNKVGEVADGTTLDRSIPAEVHGLTAQAIAAGGFHALAVEKDGGGVVAWGDDSSGQLGDGRRTTRPFVAEPVPVSLR